RPSGRPGRARPGGPSNPTRARLLSTPLSPSSSPSGLITFTPAPPVLRARRARVVNSIRRNPRARDTPLNNERHLGGIRVSHVGPVVQVLRQGEPAGVVIATAIEADGLRDVRRPQRLQRLIQRP